MIFQSMPGSFTRREWTETLEKAFAIQEGAVHQGHEYIYLNRDGQCKAFSSPSEAHEQEFNRKMTIDDIIATSQKYFADYKLCTGDEIKIVCHAFEVMDKGAQQSWWSRLIHFLRGLGFKNTHELIDGQLLQIMDQKLQRQYRTLGTNLDNIKQVLSSLNDKRFQQAYESLFHQAKLWAETPDQALPKNYQGWKTREDELNHLVLESQQMANFSQCVASILKQHEQLAQLLKLHPLAPIEKENLEKIVSSLETLINRRFAKFAIHDEASYQQELAQLQKTLEKSISLVLDDYKRQHHYQATQVDEILSPRNTISSPLIGIIALRQQQLFESKEGHDPREWGDD